MRIKNLKPGELGSFEDALAFLVRSSATGTNSMRRYSECAAASGITRTFVEALIRERGGVAHSTPVHRAMSAISGSLQQLQSTKGCFILCTGRSTWMPIRALEGSLSG